LRLTVTVTPKKHTARGSSLVTFQSRYFREFENYTSVGTIQTARNVDRAISGRGTFCRRPRSSVALRSLGIFHRPVIRISKDFLENGSWERDPGAITATRRFAGSYDTTKRRFSQRVYTWNWPSRFTVSHSSYESPWWKNHGEVDGGESTLTTTTTMVKDNEDASDTRRGAATRGTVTRGDTFPLAATEQLSERRGQESVSPHHLPNDCGGGDSPLLRHRSAALGSSRPFTKPAAPSPARAPALPHSRFSRRTWSRLKMFLSSRYYASPSSDRVNVALRWNFHRAWLSECRITARDRDYSRATEFVS